MSENTKIQWTNSTASPWYGCSMVVLPGSACECANCYAKDLAESRMEMIFRNACKNAFARGNEEFADWKTRPVWGDRATRVVSKSFFKEAIRLNGLSAKQGKKRLIFPSLMDWLDDMPGGVIFQDGSGATQLEMLDELLNIIVRTPHLVWQLLTKRPENFNKHMDTLRRLTWPMARVVADKWFNGYPPENVWVGVSCGTQKAADERIPELLTIPAKLRFLSCEPLLEKVHLIDSAMMHGIDWVIVGGESGPGARECDVAWIDDIVCQCAQANVPVFVKQLGSDPVRNGFRHPCEDPQGGDMSEWPYELQVREYPKGSIAPMHQIL